MAGRLSRFLHLEKARRDDGQGPAVPLARERFGAEPPKAQEEDEDAFRAERAAQLESGIDLDQPAPSEQPFLRCPRCEADNGKQAQRCMNCQLSLQTEGVRAWNARFWQARQAQAVAEPPAQASEIQELRDQQRRLGEALAREVAERERTRLGWMGMEGNGYDATPYGVRLLRSIESAGTRFFVALLLLGAFLGGLAMAFRTGRDSPARFVGMALAVLVLILFSPNVPRRRGFWRSDRDWWW